MKFQLLINIKKEGMQMLNHQSQSFILLINKNIKMSSFKSSENIQKKEGSVQK